MKFRFEDQPHQTAAVAAVVDLFEGALIPGIVPAGLAAGRDGNVDYQLDHEALVDNLKSVTAREHVQDQSDLVLLETTDLQDAERAFPNFSVEMETGTGKTYVYISTALQLAKQYGIRKFVILVHSVAIRAGVVKTFEQTKDHFSVKYDGVKYNWGVLGEGSALADFAEPGETVRFLVASVQALDKPNTNTLYSTKEEPQLWGIPRSGIAQIAGKRPVLIIDEPQNMVSELRKRVIATVNPLVALRYSATHKEKFNLVHRLSPKQASEAGLVKRVAVKGIVAGQAGEPYLHVSRIRSQRRQVFAEAVIDAVVGGESKRTAVSLRAGSDLFDESNGLDTYRGLVVSRVERKPDRIVFENGRVVAAGEEVGVDRRSIWRDQVRQTIRQHLARQKVIDAAGHDVKVLSLFFVEHVADYVGDAAELPIMFDSLYEEEWLNSGRSRDVMPAPADLRVAYFPSTKTGLLRDAEGSSEKAAEMQARAYEEIIANKELILDKANPRAFIFSHSALREGWDNPNVFQVGFLRQTRSDVERRQQIGRGLRLPVDQDGRRVLDPGVNQLTLVVDESFAEFKDGVNAEYSLSGISTGDRPEIDDVDHEVTIHIRKELFESAEFAELWKRIRYKARYRVALAPHALEQRVADASERLDELALIGRRANVIETAEVQYDDDGQVTTSTSTVAQSQGERLSILGRRVPDVIRLIEDALQLGKFPLQLTRPTIAGIVEAIPSRYKRNILEDPERWARIVADVIRKQAIEEMVAGIKYEPLGEETWWNADVVFLKEEVKHPIQATPGNPDPQAGVSAASVDGHNLFDAVDYDSHVERNFAAKLDNMADQVKLFAKLPRRFRVRTPVGEYSPDWALVYEQGGKPRLYLVRETKATLDLDDLEWAEAMRIRFAGKHFDAAPVGPVDYQSTTDKQGLTIGGLTGDPGGGAE
ncbi:hypothetical protein GCM10027414_04730 [Humibacter ginsengiterrae]